MLTITGKLTRYYVITVYCTLAYISNIALVVSTASVAGDTVRLLGAMPVTACAVVTAVATAVDNAAAAVVMPFTPLAAVTATTFNTGVYVAIKIYC